LANERTICWKLRNSEFSMFFLYVIPIVSYEFPATQYYPTDVKGARSFPMFK
jgi:hypothetical protein